MLHGSRFLYALAREGHAPRLFLRVNRWGIPYLTVIYFGVFMGLAYMTLSATGMTIRSQELFIIIDRLMMLLKLRPFSLGSKIS